MSQLHTTWNAFHRHLADLRIRVSIRWRRWLCRSIFAGSIWDGNKLQKASDSCFRALAFRGLTLGFAIILAHPAFASLPAFPGAEGFGASAKGGRGGTVIHVTNLDDSGPGSLRAAVDAPGARIVVFDVGGTITLRSKIHIENPYITIAGQTAPGGGIALRTDESYAGPAISIAANDVVIRYLRVRPGPSRRLSVNVDAVVITGGQRIIIDHCSLSWGTDEVLSTFRSPREITVQWSIIAEGLHSTTHKKGPHSRGALLGGFTENISFHHNVLAHNFRRTPRVSGVQIGDIVNNIIYNWGDQAIVVQGAERHAKVNVVGNYAIAGSDTISRALWMIKRGTGRASIYVRGNIGPTRPAEALPEVEAVHPADRESVVSIPHPVPPISTTSALEAYDRVITFAGALLPVRDSVDSRLINDVVNLTGSIIDHPAQVGGWPDLASSRRPPDFDRDGDGMPDNWEVDLGYNPADPDDGILDADGDGYTNVEQYLNQLAQLPPRVEAGDDQTVELPSVAILSGTAVDDGIPNAAGEIAYSWSVASGPGPAYFSAPTAANSTVTFTASGRYILRLSASDGETSSSDDVAVTVTGCCPGPTPSRARVRMPLKTTNAESK